MTLPFKLGLGVFAIGSVTGLGYVSASYFTEDKEKITNKGSSISELIKKEFKYVLLNTKEKGNDDSSFWRINWESYLKNNSEKDTNKDSFKLNGWTKNNKTDLTLELKKACEKVFKNIVVTNSDSVFQNVEKYCTRGVTVKEEAENKKITILNTTASGADSKIWDKRMEDKQTLSTGFVKLGINETNDQLTKEIISKGCENAKNRNKKEEDYDAIYEAYKKVCTKQSDDPQ